MGERFGPPVPRLPVFLEPAERPERGDSLEFGTELGVETVMLKPIPWKLCSVGHKYRGRRCTTCWPAMAVNHKRS